MPKAKLYSNNGTLKSDVELPESHFGQKVSESAIHQAVVIYLNNQRQGTAKTKSRSEVSGGGKKPWRQKGTGRARSGSNTSPIWVRGGKAHGANPRDYIKKINKKLRQKAFVSALSLKAESECVHVFEDLALDAPKTKALHTILNTAKLTDKKNIIVVTEANDTLSLASRNIPATDVCRVQDVCTYDLMNAENLILTQSSIEAIQERK